MALTELSLFVTQVLASSTDDDGSMEWAALLLLSGFIFYSVMYIRYRNTDKRHHHEKETNAVTLNIEGDERKVRELTNLRNSTMRGSNERLVRGARVGIEKSTLDRLADQAGGMFSD